MKPMEDLSAFLADIPLFAACRQETVSKLIGNGAQLVLKSGDSLDRSYLGMLGIVLNGSADIVSADQGKPVILRSLCSRDVFGAASLFTRGNAPLSTITATAPCQLLFLSRDAVREALSADEKFLDAFLSFLADRVSFLNRKIRCFTAGSAERRLALWLISEERDALVLPVLTVLSEMLDIGRASLYRALDKLKDEGLIERNGREITILDRTSILNMYQ